jgi:hypothetical protein
MRLKTAFETRQGTEATEISTLKIDLKSLTELLYEALAPYHKSPIELSLMEYSSEKTGIDLLFLVSGMNGLNRTFSVWLDWGKERNTINATLNTFVEGFILFSIRILDDTIFFNTILNKDIRKIGVIE